MVKKRKVFCYVIAIFVFYFRGSSSKQNKVLKAETSNSDESMEFNFTNCVHSMLVFVVTFGMMKLIKKMYPKIFKRFLNYLEPNKIKFPTSKQLDLNNSKILNILNRRESENMKFFVNISKMSAYVKKIRDDKNEGDSLKKELKYLEERQNSGLKNVDKFADEINRVVTSKAESMF